MFKYAEIVKLAYHQKMAESEKPAPDASAGVGAWYDNRAANPKSNIARTVRPNSYAQQLMNNNQKSPWSVFAVSNYNHRRRWK